MRHTGVLGSAPTGSIVHYVSERARQCDMSYVRENLIRLGKVWAERAMYVAYRSRAAGICRPAPPPPSGRLLSFLHGCK